jgi:saccharopine dehydrogenase (NAD+, L-lysine-forming)
MSSEQWLIYGAAGYTGRLVAEEAVRRGHRPVLAARSAEKLLPLAERLGLRHVVVDLGDEQTLTRAIGDSQLVFHAAGPFARTSEPMVRACLRAGAHYVDITGEIDVFEANLARHDEARRKGIVLMSGVGFDVVPNGLRSAIRR